MGTATLAKRPKPPKPTARKEDPINVQYEARAKSALKNAMVQRGIDFEGLSERLAAMGVEISPKGLENKISRGGFSAAFLYQCMEAMEINLAALPR